MRIWIWVLCACGCSLKQRYNLSLCLIPDESESTSRWISCSTLNTHKNMLHKGPHLGNSEVFESRLILWTVIFPQRHLHAPGITELWGDYRHRKKGYKSKNFSFFLNLNPEHRHKQQGINTLLNIPLSSCYKVSIILHWSLTFFFLQRWSLTISTCNILCGFHFVQKYEMQF